MRSQRFSRPDRYLYVSGKKFRLRAHMKDDSYTAAVDGFLSIATFAAQVDRSVDGKILPLKGLSLDLMKASRHSERKLPYSLPSSPYENLRLCFFLFSSFNNDRSFSYHMLGCLPLGSLSSRGPQNDWCTLWPYASAIIASGRLGHLVYQYVLFIPIPFL
ncbi:hypothetical protein BDZ89DRAFT_297992 [Hymenopellis radicata]|nr:hypothetical protein BDZ89DRAFT_297992 [Hymenopellis radicata]